jgi:hypothetical protein
MMLSKSGRHAALAVSLVIGLAACNGADTVDLSTTSSVISGQPPAGEATTTSVEPGGSTTTVTTMVGQTVDEYEVVGRESDATGETIYVVVPPAAYTDVDIENFVLDLFERGTATYGAEVFNDVAAADAFRKPEAERSEDETALIGQHHLASLVEGTTIVFRGPLAGSGETVIGS